MALINKQHHKVYTFTSVIEKDEDGYFAYVPQLPGCHTQGDTYEEALANINEATQAYLRSMIKTGEEIPNEKDITVSLNKLELSI
ncbi:MAG: type II toxin-antitoxin system HicB family antitoxin [Patescibacteria group bacterium]